MRQKEELITPKQGLVYKLSSSNVYSQAHEKKQTPIVTIFPLPNSVDKPHEESTPKQSK